MSFLLLMVAFVLTGVLSITNKALVQWGLGEYRDLYMLAYYAAATLLGMVVTVTRRKKSRVVDGQVGITMGLGGALSMLFLLLALQHMQGIVAFPVRSLGNLIVTALVSITAWKEHLSRSQWLGIVISIIAIWLIS